MKKLSLIVFIAFVGITVFAQKNDITVNNLCRKWKLEKYEVFWIDYDLEEKEKNDYLTLFADMTYESVDEGEYSTGTWKLQKVDAKYYIILKGIEGILKLKVEELKKENLVLIIDDEELIDLEIHFKSI